MSGGVALSAVALTICAVLVAASLSRRDVDLNLRNALIWAAIIAALAMLLAWLKWR